MVLTNLIIDGSYLIMKDVHILNKTRTIHTDLEKLLRNDFDRISKMFPFTNIYFVSDKGTSWRKEIYNVYKGNREKDTKIDWEYVYKTYRAFKDMLRTKNNVKVIEIEGLEGDDIIAYIVNKSNKQNYSNVVVSNDGDLHQFIKFDLTNNWINVQWNYRFNDERFYVPDNYNMFIQKLLMIENNDIFNLDNSSEFGIMLETIISRTKVREIINEKSLFCKLLEGDKGDNIMTVIKIKDRGIGESGARKCYEMYKNAFPEVIDFDSETFKKRSVDIISYYKKINSDSIRQNIYNNLETNLRLIKLDYNIIPKRLVEKLNNTFTEYVEPIEDDFWNE